MIFRVFAEIYWSVFSLFAEFSNMFRQPSIGQAPSRLHPTPVVPAAVGRMTQAQLLLEHRHESFSTPPSVPLLRAAALSEHAVEHGPARLAQRRPARRGGPLLRQEGARPRMAARVRARDRLGLGLGCVAARAAAGPWHSPLPRTAPAVHAAHQAG